VHSSNTTNSFLQEENSFTMVRTPRARLQNTQFSVNDSLPERQ
jgi:hypothetical protein